MRGALGAVAVGVSLAVAVGVPLAVAINRFSSDTEAELALVRDYVAARATLVEGDLTREPLLGERRFDLVTAFRFFPNAEPALRRDVMAALVRRAIAR